MKKITFLLLNGICIFILAVVVKFYTPADLEKLPTILKGALTYLVVHKGITATICGGYIFVYSLFPKWILPHKEKGRLIKEMLKRINTELLGGDPQLHRVTLFKETCYVKALIKNYWMLIRHLFYSNRWRSKLYLKWPQWGRYLIIDARYGLQYEKSSTMFKIEHNELESCHGIAGCIRFKQMSMLLVNLPDIRDIDFKDIKKIRSVNRNRRKDVLCYMKEGFIRDFEALRKMHRKARHFYGTIITKKDGSPWGVLLIDSISDNHPFTPEVKARFNSFATSLCDIINLEV